MGYPRARPRRLRLTRGLRDLVAEARLHPSQLMLPVFVSEAVGEPRPLRGLPWLREYPPVSGELVEYLQSAMDLGVRSFLLFGITPTRDPEASRAWARDGPVQVALRTIRRELGWEPVLAADLCICGYHSEGHCGLPREGRRGRIVDNDSTLEVYRRIAVSQAEAGADIVAPSGMMDGQVAAIRDALESEGYWDVAIMAYSAKYASVFYGPFREAMDSAPRWGDRRSYQMDPRNALEALREVELDLEEGADIVMVKPALAYLDVIRLVKERHPEVPLAAYNVSGEAALVELASREGLAPREALLMEVLTAIRRAGADIIITYHAAEAAKLIREGFNPF
ncbi:MAG: porphobilinogen synthase [Desulfurococcales archaeon]|nr:porphobilinogen synthase [Desulfurococcales archaeon]